MLDGKDRIFTNFSGHHDWRLEEAKKRGARNGATDFIGMGREWNIQQVHDSLPSVRGKDG